MGLRVGFGVGDGMGVRVAWYQWAVFLVPAVASSFYRGVFQISDEFCIMGGYNFVHVGCCFIAQFRFLSVYNLTQGVCFWKMFVHQL